MSRSAMLLIVVAGLYGAGGVTTAAAAAHASGDARLPTIALFLMVHGAALVGAAALSSHLGRLVLLPAWGIALGVLLFCGDLLVRIAFGASPIPMVAPIGGTILIAAWLAVAVGAGVGALRR